MRSTAIPRYGRPPVTEVVCGTYFQDLDLLQVGHLGRFWDRLKADYPRTETLPPLPSVVTAAGSADLSVPFGFVSFETNPFPRVWFVSDDGMSLVQLQRDRLVVNWRRAGDGAGDATGYPGYDLIVERLKKVYLQFVQFLSEEELGEPELVGLEVAYVNTFLFGRELAGPAEVGNLMPFLAWGSVKLGQPLELSGVSWNAQLDLPNAEGNLHISLNTTQRRTDGEGTMRLDLLARKFSPRIETSDIWKWFDFAHESVVTTFAGITSTDVQDRIWERQT